MKVTLRIIALASLIYFELTQTTFADVKSDPTDYVPMPPGTDINILYLQSIKFDNFYNDGHRTPQNIDITVNTGVARYVNYSNFFNTNMIWSRNIILPYGHQQVAGKSDISTMGDAIVGGTLWTMSDFINNRHLGWALFLTMPTGDHKEDGFALSNDRWALDFQSSYVHGLSESWTWEATAEAELYTKKKHADSTKDTFYQTHNHLRYNFSPKTWMAVSHRYSWGGAEKYDGMETLSDLNNSALGISAATMVTPNAQILLNYWQDVHVTSGLAVERSFQLRLAYAY